MNNLTQLDMFRSAPPELQDFGLESAWMIRAIQQPGGVCCPLCKRHAQRYLRTITAAMAKALVCIYRYYQSHRYDTWLQLEGYLKRCDVGSTIRGDAPKLRFWGLIEKSTTPINGRQGHYRITAKGQRFVKGNESVPKYIKIYNDKFYGFEEGEEITISECIENFSLEKLLNM